MCHCHHCHCTGQRARRFEFTYFIARIFLPDSFTKGVRPIAAICSVAYRAWHRARHLAHSATAPVRSGCQLEGTTQLSTAAKEEAAARRFLPLQNAFSEMRQLRRALATCFWPSRAWRCADHLLFACFRRGARSGAGLRQRISSFSEPQPSHATGGFAWDIPAAQM